MHDRYNIYLGCESLKQLLNVYNDLKSKGYSNFCPFNQDHSICQRMFLKLDSFECPCKAVYSNKYSLPYVKGIVKRVLNYNLKLRKKS